MNRDKIKVLNEREQSRSKVAIWFGSRDNFIHPFKEVVANGIDEINNNFDKGEITVKLMKDNTITVTDTGRGIPLLGETDGIPNYELLLLKLFAGTNYDNGENGKIAVGTNGVGLTVTNYCSSYFSIKSYKQDEIAGIIFGNGGEILKPLERYKNNTGFTGTKITFQLDTDVFGDYKYNIEEIENILKRSAGVNSRINFKFQYENEDIKEYNYDSLEEYFEEVAVDKTCKNIIGDKRLFENEIEYQEKNNFIIEKNEIELILSTSSNPVQEGFLNITHLSEGGTINEGVINGVRLFANKYIKDKKLIDKKLGAIANNDIEESISFVCNVLSTVVEFANQTKLSTNKKLYKEIVQKYTQDLLEVELIQNPKNIERFIKHILEVQKFNNKAQASKRALQKKLNEKVDSLSNRIEGLVDCKEHGMNSELFIAEGKSALGSIILARNARNQAGMAIRGKITNCLKIGYDEIFKSETVTDIIKALGCGIETDKKNKELGEFHIENIRYGKIICSCDADADGYQICCLLLTMFYRLTPTLIKEGMIYIARTPLYEVRMKDDTDLYWFSEEDKEQYIKQYGYDNISNIARCKG